MKFVRTSLLSQRALIAFALFASAVLFWRPTADPFALPKATVVVAVAVLVWAVAAARVVVTRRVVVPVTPVLGLVVVFVMALLVTTATSSSPAISAVGEYAYYAGLVPYFSYASLLVFTVRTFKPGDVLLVVKSLLASLVLVVGYGLLQLAGVDPFTWVTYEVGGIGSTMGNPNYAAGYLGAVMPLGLWGAFSSSLSPAWRSAAAIAFLAGNPVLVGTGSLQGGLALAAGLAVVFAAWLLEKRPRFGSFLPGIALLGVFIGVVTLAIVLVVGPGSLPVANGALGERYAIWTTAREIFVAHPLLGSGLDTFAQHFMAYRPASHAVATGFTIAETAHNVPLGMFANGGVVLGVSYLAIVVYTAWTLVQGLRTSDEGRGSVLGAFGAVWAGYQVQSFVSSDVPALAVLHWTVTGALVVLATRPEVREFALPGAQPRARPKPTPATTAVHGVLVILTLVALVVLVRPLRADIHAAAGVQLARQGDVAAGLRRLATATDLAPFRSVYLTFQAAVLERAGNTAAAARAADLAANRAPGESQVALQAAGLAEKVGALEDARKWYGESVDRDPANPRVLAAAAEFYRRQGEANVALVLYEQAVKLNENDPALQASLLETRQEARRSGDDDETT